MHCIDFEFDGQKLSDYKCRVCKILEDGGSAAINIGSQISFETIMTNENKFKLISTKYEEAFTTIIEICKYDCGNTNNNIITNEEFNKLMRWLNKKGFKKFKMIYENNEISNVYFNASFNLQPILFYNEIIGVQLTMQTDAPFAYYDEVQHIIEFTTDSLECSFIDNSDEVGHIYPASMTIEILEDGDFKLLNLIENNRMTSIKNCINGEIITLVENKIISSSEIHKKLYNDFNYIFPRICNTEDNRENIFSVNIPCKITFSYSPICKTAII